MVGLVGKLGVKTVADEAESRSRRVASALEGASTLTIWGPDQEAERRHWKQRVQLSTMWLWWPSACQSIYRISQQQAPSSAAGSCLPFPAFYVRKGIGLPLRSTTLPPPSRPHIGFIVSGEVCFAFCALPSFEPPAPEQSCAVSRAALPLQLSALRRRAQGSGCWLRVGTASSPVTRAASDQRAAIGLGRRKLQSC
jgi:hypothetical protein